MNAEFDKAIAKLETVGKNIGKPRTPLNIAGDNLNVTEIRSQREQMLAKARRLRVMLENNTLSRELIQHELSRHLALYKIREEEL